MRVIAASAVAFLFVAASCTNETASPPTLVPERCRMPVSAAAGFEETLIEDVEQGPTIGVRTFYSAPRDRHLVYTAGVLMDFFDDEPRSKLKLRDGSDAWLFGAPGEKWILFWYQPDRCKQFSIGGEGFSKIEFLDLMRELGRLPENSP